jgi:hypothetical protein
MAREQSSAGDTGRRSSEDIVRPGAKEEVGRGGAEDTARLDAGEERRADGATPERPAGQVEREGPAPEPAEARGEGATTMVMEWLVLAEKTPGRLEGSSVVVPNAASNEAGTNSRIAATSEGDRGAGSSWQSGGGINWVIVHCGVPEDFVCVEREEEEFWQE